jgi:4-amino-4-deoxy-L-arabinose transferase-like glycosyltransferase
VTAALVWLFTPAALFLATGTYVDLALAFYVFMAMYALMLWMESGDALWVAAAGGLSGIALGIKYTGVLAAAFIFLAVLVKQRSSRSFRPVLLFSLLLAATFLPWLAKNYLLLHNPVAPWGTSFFHGSLVTLDTAERYFAHIRDHGIPINGAADLLALPWHLTVQGFRFGGGFDILGPVLLLFMPALFFKLKIDKILKVLLLFAVWFIFFWLGTGKVLRFLFPILPFLCIFAAYGFHHSIEEKWLKVPALLFLGAAVLHNILLFHWCMAPVDPYAVVLGGQTRSGYLAQKVSYYNALERAVNPLPPASRVLFWGETRGYYCAVPALVPSVFDRHPLVAWANGSADSAELAARLRKAGITHLLVNNRELSRLRLEEQLTGRGKRNINDLKQHRASLLFDDAVCQVYEITH